jgi:hypothetical protein
MLAWCDSMVAQSRPVVALSWGRRTAVRASQPSDPSKLANVCHELGQLFLCWTYMGPFCVCNGHVASKWHEFESGETYGMEMDKYQTKQENVSSGGKII